MADKTAKYQAPWGQLLIQAVNEPGKLHDGYSMFWNYSSGNQQLALSQCHEHGIMPGPLGTFKGWLMRGRVVRKGQHALVLCMPRYFKQNEQEREEGKARGMFFVYPRAWFTLHQTDPREGYQGLPWEAAPLPGWNREQALATLDITEEPFQYTNGNAQGYSRPEARILAINPLAKFPYKTTFHELAHIVLKHQHTDEVQGTDKEVEAEAVAFILGHQLQVEVDGLTSSRAYIQHYMSTNSHGWETGGLNDKMSSRVFTASEKILRAGLPARAAVEVEAAA